RDPATQAGIGTNPFDHCLQSQARLKVHKSFAVEILQRHLAPLGQGRTRAGDQHQVFLVAAYRLYPGRQGFLIQCHERQVHLPACHGAQQSGAGVLAQCDAHPWILGVKAGEEIGQVHRGEGLHAAEGQLAGLQTRHRTHLGAGIGGRGQDSARRLDQMRTGRRRVRAPGSTLQQRRAHLFLQPANGGTQPGLGQAELIGGSGEAAHIGHGHQVTQPAQIQQIPRLIAHSYRSHHIHFLDLSSGAADPGGMSTDRHPETSDTAARSISTAAGVPEKAGLPGADDLTDADRSPSAGAGTPHRAAEAARAGISPRLVLVMALASGLVVANSYYAQPVVSIIAETFSASTTSVGLVVTASQIGYAVGLAFLVPLGDLIERRRLLTGVLSVTALCLVAMAIAPSWQVLGAAALLVGVSSVVGQVLVPFAASLAAEHERGRVIGNVMTGLLLGILLSRVVAGLVTEALGWRAMFWIAAALMVLTGILLRRELPRVDPPAQLRYGALLRSVVALVREEPLLRRRMAYGALTYAPFGVFWTPIGLLLAGEPYHFSDAQIGLFTLFG